MRSQSRPIFSAAIFRGRVWILAGSGKPGERALVIPTHRQFTGDRHLASIKICRLTASNNLSDDPGIEECESQHTREIGHGHALDCPPSAFNRQAGRKTLKAVRCGV